MSIKEELLRLLREDEDFRRQLAELLSAQLLLIQNQKIDQISSSLNELIKIVAQQAQSINQLAQRVDQLTQRVDELGKRMDLLAQIVAEHDKRLDQLTQSLNELTKRIDQLAQIVAEHDKRLDQLTQHIDELGKRIDQLAQIAAEHDKRIDKLTQSLESFRESTEKKLNQLERSIGSISATWGIYYEDVITDFARELIEREGLDYKYVNKFTFKDKEGKYGLKGKIYEIDLLIQDDKVYFIEVKATAELNDVEWFDVKCDVIKKVLNLRTEPIKLIFAMSAYKDAVERANELGIKLVTENVIEIPKRKRGEEKST